VRHLHVEAHNVHSLVGLGQTSVKSSYQVVPDLTASIEQLIGIVLPIFCFRKKLSLKVLYGLGPEFLFFTVIADNDLGNILARVVD